MRQPTGTEELPRSRLERDGEADRRKQADLDTKSAEMFKRFHRQQVEARRAAHAPATAKRLRFSDGACTGPYPQRLL